MHDNLIQYIRDRSETPLSDDEVAVIKEVFIPKKLKKRQFLLQQGEVCASLGFIVKGATRQYTIDDKGGEHVLNLYIENWWTADRESFIRETPSPFNIDAWEDTELLLLRKANGSYDRMSSIAAWREMRLKLEENNYFANQDRIEAAINQGAEERYECLLRRHPEFIQRFPQHIIASYLGITKETLSRIRNQSVRKHESQSR